MHIYIYLNVCECVYMGACIKSISCTILFAYKKASGGQLDKPETHIRFVLVLLHVLQFICLPYQDRPLLQGHPGSATLPLQCPIMKVEEK